MKRFFTLILAVLMLAGLALPVFAEGEITLNITNNRSSTNISINGSTVSAYKLFDVDASADGKSYAYYLDDQFKNDKDKEILGVYFDFVTSLDGRINVIPNEDCTDANKLEMAKKFVDEGLLTGKTAAATAAGAEEKAELTLTTKGYYLVTASGKVSSTGADVQSVLMMDTVTATKDIAIKASAPKLDKNVTKNSTNQKGNSFNVGDSVPFEISVKLTDMLGYSSYYLKITDTLSSGLTAPEVDDISVLVNGAATTVENTVSVENNVITVVIPEAISLKDTTVTVSYSAVLNKTALTTECETNTVNLQYSNNPYNTASRDTTPSVVDKVYNFDVIVDKYAGAADAADKNPKLSDAKFVLAKQTGTDTDNKPVYTYYKLVTAGENKTVSWVAEVSDDMIVTTDSQGKASFTGIEAGTYYLIEKQAPRGYNMLQEPVTVTVAAAYNADGTIDTTGTTTTVSDSGTRWSVTQSVANQPGRLLPSTGGMGTTLFYILGCLMVLSFGVLLVTKRRMYLN